MHLIVTAAPQIRRLVDRSIRGHTKAGWPWSCLWQPSGESLWRATSLCVWSGGQFNTSGCHPLLFPEATVAPPVTAHFPTESCSALRNFRAGIPRRSLMLPAGIHPCLSSKAGLSFLAKSDGALPSRSLLFAASSHRPAAPALPDLSADGF